MNTAGAIDYTDGSLPGPNEEVLEAQARVCTGPHQARPLGTGEDDPQPQRTIALILASLRGQLPWDDRVSPAQMGAFLAAMTIRRGFVAATNWSDAEHAAFEASAPALRRELPEELAFLLQPDRGCKAVTSEEEPVIGALTQVLRGEHLSYGDTLNACAAILKLQVRPSLAAALLIGQRMNLETYDELRGHLDAMRVSAEVVPLSVAELTHIGQPYDGNRRYLHPGVFAAAVRAALGHPSILHGVEEMAPKRGTTQEQILTALGAATDLTLSRAGQLIEDANIGFAYVSQREYAPQAYRLHDLRAHIAKRPTWATVEKVQQLFSCEAANHMIVGYYHAGYEQRLLQLMWDRGFDSGIVIKGEEGTCNYSLRSPSPSTNDRKAINYTGGFRRSSGERVDFTVDVDPLPLGFHYDQNPRPQESGASHWADAGRRALAGESGPVHDRIILNAAMPLVWTGVVGDAASAITAARGAVASGRALQHLERYIGASQQR
jgi:anthranilate phosphoribosyltransferase